MEKFERALEFLFAEEGGFANRSRKDDPGGATKYGVTIGTLSDYRGEDVSVQDVRDLSKEEAAAIYQKLYWDAAHCDELPEPLAVAVFDAAVLSGPGRAIRWLQTALGVASDGKVGPRTLAAADAADPLEVVSRMLSLRQHFHETLSNYRANPGWTRRLFRVAFRAGQVRNV